jgi:HSP20 family protein
MTLTRWDPFPEFTDLTPLREAMDRLLTESFVGVGRAEPFGRMFPVDVRETSSDFVIEAALPGLTPDEMEITATDTTVTIHATHKTDTKTESRAESKTESKKEEGGHYVRRERHIGELRRLIGLPSRLDPERITATYDRGVLTLHVPKARDVTRKQIPIHVQE